MTRVGSWLYSISRTAGRLGCVSALLIAGLGATGAASHTSESASAPTARATVAAPAAIRLTEAGGGHGEAKPKTNEQADEPPLPPDAGEASRSSAEQYCASVQGAAAAAQISLRKKELDAAESALEIRVKQLDEKLGEIKTWLQRREDFLKQANQSLTEIYAKMTPEAAAARLVAMNEMVAAAILSKLPPKGASSILAEMETAKAAKLSSLLAGAADVVREARPSAKVSP